MVTSNRSSLADAGFSLIEVLIAVAVLAIGLLSVAALQIQGVRQNFDSYARSQAVMLANDYVERMYANKPGADLGSYADFDTADIDCSSVPNPLCVAGPPTSCTPTQLADYDRFVVFCGYATPTGRFGGVRDLLQSGRMIVTCINAAGNPVASPCPTGLRHQIEMRWVEQIKGADNRFAGTSTDLPVNDLIVTVQP